MALSQNLYQKQTQRLVITQDLRQSIELLPLSNLELSEKIQKEILENPLLEETESSSTPELDSMQARNETREGQREREESEGDGNWQREEDNWREDRTMVERQRSDYGTENKHQFLQNAVQAPESLAGHLLWQLRLSDLDDVEMQAGEIIISAIDERGFLVEDLGDLMADQDIPLEAASTALETIHTFDPIGCGARDIQESLILQTRLLRPEDEISLTLLKKHFVDLEKLDYRRIEKASEINDEQIEAALQFIRTLEPYPGTLFSGRQPDYIIPDVLVVEVEGKFQVLINDDWMPGLRVNEEYKAMIQSTGAGSEDREYMQSRLNSAQWLIKSIRQRRHTLFRVMTSIVEFQEDFFRSGPVALRPLTLRMVAEKVELHESTVSRITTNKYVQTRWGVFELKYFFSSSLRSRTGADGHSARSIQDRIRLLVEEEDPENPLSDQEIMDRIRAEGVQIARRTVAKYRKILKILPADRRKKLKKLHSRGNPSAAD
ncbi:MAG: RNA polymerase factor sigma-54 [Leptospiraceae bacterium]|nr:RNA polymerase factor sigma-54 [Leptospiraceae bacterium]